MITAIMLAGLSSFSDTSALSRGKIFPLQRCSVISTVYGKKDTVSDDTRPSFFMETGRIRLIEKLGDKYFRLESFSSLKKGWDGYHAEAIPESVISKTRDLLLEVKTPSNPKLQVFPTGRKTVQIEYYIDDNNQIEVEVFQEHYNVFVASQGAEKEEQVTKKKAITILNDFIYGQECSITNRR